MILTGITLTNWLRYRGEHTLRLEPKAYSVVARWEGDDGRSNWAGKTSLVEAVRFALYGQHRHRTEDAWITSGEDEGGVRLEFDTGLVVERRRRRGKSTKLSAKVEDLVVGAGDEGQRVVDAAVGMTLRDFEATLYFDQRSIAKLVTTEPGERMKVVEEWLQLGKVAVAEKHNEELLVRYSGYAEDYGRRANLAREREQALLAGLTREEIEHARLAKGEEVEDLSIAARNAAQALAEARASEQQRLRTVEEMRRYQQLVEDGTRMADRVDELKDEVAKARPALHLQQELGECRQKVGEARTAAGLVQQAASGVFKGTCPVAGIECPATLDINRRIRQSSALHDEKLRQVRALEARAEQVSGELRRAQGGESELRSAEARLQAMREEARRSRERLDNVRQLPVDLAALELAKKEADEALDRAHVDEIELSMRAREAEVSRKRAEDDERQARDYEALASTFREAARVLGPSGLKRRLSAPFLAGLELGANGALSESGVDLSVRVVWEHEGKDPARACECGHPFPESAKVKECPRCGAARGRHLVNRLEFELSNRSVAAEDIAGVALQLSASAWLRQRRGSALSVAFLDEPLAHCDRTNRREMTRAIAGMLPRFGLRQALVVSHSPDTQAALPGTILVTGGREGSRCEVVA